MSHQRHPKSAAAGGIVVSLAFAAATVGAQNGNLPNPYHEVAGWAKLPAGAKWAGVISVDPAPHGDIWVFHRSDPPIIRFDQSGKVVKSFGEGMFVQAHALTVHRDRSVWFTAAKDNHRHSNHDFTFFP